jgi:NADH-quinone oxidoreductase subunit E
MESVVKDFEETGRKVAKAVSDEIESAVSTAAATPSAKPASIRAGATPKARKSEKQAAEKADTSTVKMKKPAAIEKPSAVDDLKKISGVGPKLEMVLNDLGVFTFGQIAAWTAAEIAWIDDYLSFSGRIERDKWIEQASSLAGKKTAANSG